MVVCIELAGDSLQFNSFFKKSEDKNVYKLGFQGTLMKIEFCWRLIFEILLSINLSWGHVRSHTQFWPDQFSHTQTSKVYVDKFDKILTVYTTSIYKHDHK